MPDKTHAQPQDAVTRQTVENMKKLRRERNLTQGELAMELNLRNHTAINKTVIVNLENQRRADMTVAEAVAVAELFNVSLTWLVSSHGPKCNWCKDMPPEGYRCVSCLAEGAPESRVDVHTLPVQDPDLTAHEQRKLGDH